MHECVAQIRGPQTQKKKHTPQVPKILLPQNFGGIYFQKKNLPQKRRRKTQDIRPAAWLTKEFHELCPAHLGVTIRSQLRQNALRTDLAKNRGPKTRHVCFVAKAILI